MRESLRAGLCWGERAAARSWRVALCASSRPPLPPPNMSGVQGLRCVVPGGSGLVGRQLVEMLVQRGAASVVSLTSRRPLPILRLSSSTRICWTPTSRVHSVAGTKEAAAQDTTRLPHLRIHTRGLLCKRSSQLA